jgi:hypothetical protein
VLEVMGPGLKIIGAPTTIARRGSKRSHPLCHLEYMRAIYCSIVWRKLHPPSYALSH